MVVKAKNVRTRGQKIDTTLQLIQEKIDNQYTQDTPFSFGHMMTRSLDRNVDDFGGDGQWGYVSGLREAKEILQDAQGTRTRRKKGRKLI